MVTLCHNEKLAYSNPVELLDIYNNYKTVLASLQKNTREVVENFYELIIKSFTKQVDVNNKKGYLFSALISDLLLSNEELKIDAIYYPSAKNNGSTMNIAVKPNIIDTRFEITKIAEAIVISKSDEYSKN